MNGIDTGIVSDFGIIVQRVNFDAEISTVSPTKKKD